jgi:hypothetical protein
MGEKTSRYQPQCIARAKNISDIEHLFAELERRQAAAEPSEQ